ncbi:tetratricopeptide repeat protein [Actinoplanes sp. LDG1-06]|uniref:Tetratricopeptide repeat protein n=1 Tax=Paractinoplanes ovalisporus TaxID=2810368 RepID=A0ABS2AVN2_9ACTN|nr:BTAD domain-containing putative transcriptional regulator [Actinoplanes ovalisporus]MBM2623915.1 tetratricopeptide repeat protein [Actinoplanes ovalisporus]
MSEGATDGRAGMGAIEFGVLGPLVVRSGAETVALPGGMAYRLLALLLARAGEALPIDRLADQLWDGRPPRTARKTTQVYLHHLRRVLPDPDRIRLTTAGYRLVAEPDELDSGRLETLVRRAAAAPPDQAGTLLDEALGLWRGTPFAGVTGVPMVDEARDRLTDLRLTAVEESARAGRHADLLPLLRSLAAEQPYRERLHEHLMIALSLAGRRAEALAVYRDLRERLDTELGVEPGPAIQERHRLILRGDPLVAPGRPMLLPRDIPDFTGRTAELDRLDEIADEPSAVTVVCAIGGLGGVGKTALAVHWSHRAQARFPDGQLYLNLFSYDHRPVRGTAEALHHLLACLGVPGNQIPATVDGAAARYRAELAGKRMLVVLDDAQDTDQIRTLLPGEPRCHVLVTSRTSLSGLIARDGARRITLSPLPGTDAKALLHAVVGAARCVAEPEAVDDLVTLCGGLPLAVRIAAAHLVDRPTTPIADYVTELRAAGRVEGLRLADDEQYAVKAVLDRSTAALSPPDRAAFALLGVIPGRDFTAAALAAMTPPARADRAGATLERFVAARLVDEGAPGRFTLHDLVREYALGLAGDPVEPLGRLLAYYRAATGRASEALRPGLSEPEAGEAMTVGDAQGWFAAEHDNLAAAIVAGARHGLDDDVRALVDPLWKVCYAIGSVDRWISVFESALTALPGDGSGLARLAVLNTLGNAYVVAGRYDRAVPAHEECAREWSLAGQAVDAARATANLAVSYERLGRFDEALAAQEAALETFREAGLRNLEAYVLAVGIPDVRKRIGDYAGARDSLLAALELIRPDGMSVDVAQALNNLADVCQLTGDLDQAVSYADEAMRVARAVGSRHLETMTMTTMAAVLRSQGRLAESLALSEQTQQSFEEMGMAGMACENRLEMARTQAAAAHIAEAAETYSRAATEARALGERLLLARALSGLGDCTAASARKRAYREEALSLFDALGAPEAEPLRKLLAEG